ncbi:hypothetical protein AV654_19485 [Paenibacillus elgii]|uniref:Uncharacterized protein n=1 Tax=Paenibacillus elgii TaxID=189691 RepID=A0A163XN33_9BACL|nr:hypothetical protein [Paenibacillus elgii]KZE78160.1 hypothetical protein AV654_19485 [Paenibacillus elgii]
MKLDKRSEAGKKAQRVFKILFRIAIAGLLVGAVGWYLVAKGYIQFELSETVTEGPFAWFFRIVRAQGWISGIVVAVLFICGVIGYFFESERKKRQAEIVAEIENKKRW